MFALCTLLAACQHHQAASRDDDTTANFSPGIMPEDLAVHFHALSAPALRDRSPGSDGERRTVAYLIEQFERMGLQPGNGDSWTQDVPFVASRVRDAARTTLRIADGAQPLSLSWGTDMVVNSPAALPHAAIDTSPLVFAGYGIVAPEQAWNDYDGQDLKGKTVIVLINDPGWNSQDPALFHGRWPTLFGSWRYKVEEAARRGAAAVFVVHDETAAGFAWQSVLERWAGPWYSLPEDTGGRATPALAGWLTTAAAQRLFADAGLDFDTLRESAHHRGFRPVALPVKASLAIDSDISRGTSPNVIARLPGSKRSDDAIVYATHWDHPDARDSQSLHGVAQSAAGLAGLLELAEAFTHRAPKPHRSVLFVALTLEEAGMLGARYYVDHPPMPLEHTVAEIELDALPGLGPSRDLNVVGYGESQMDDYLADALRSQRRSLTPDDERTRALLFHSDTLSFASRGVPVLYARSGLNLLDGGVAAGRTRYGAFLAASASQPQADVDPGWDMRGVAEDLRALFMVGGRLSMDASYPQWKPMASFHRPVTMVAR
jgi:Zn-dependent M28 family amino/carboxypeptidase